MSERRRKILAAEAVTDAQGRYFILWWGPRPRPVLEWLEGAPVLTDFKTGYEARFEGNRVSRNTYVQTSEWDGRVIELRKFQGTPQQRLDKLRFVFENSGIGFSEVKRLYDEILKEAPLPVPGANAFFERVEECKERRR